MLMSFWRMLNRMRVSFAAVSSFKPNESDETMLGYTDMTRFSSFQAAETRNTAQYVHCRQG
jgi:hypothetical protein